MTVSTRTSICRPIVNDGTIRDPYNGSVTVNVHADGTGWSTVVCLPHTTRNPDSTVGTFSSVEMHPSLMGCPSMMTVHPISLGLLTSRSPHRIGGGALDTSGGRGGRR